MELTADFPHFLMEIAKNAVEDNFSDYLSNLQSVKGDSFLEELDDLNLGSLAEGHSAKQRRVYGAGESRLSAELYFTR